MLRHGMGLCVLIASAGAADRPARIQGDYIEDRSNKVYGCYCEWSGERVTGGKEAILGWRIQSGDYEGVSLAGLKLAAVVIGESTLSAGSTSRRSLVFVDSASPEPRRQAGERWLRERYQALLGDVIGTHPVVVEFNRDTERAVLRIGDMVSVELRKARPIEDALQGAVLWYDPFIPLEETTLGTTLNTRYRGEEFSHQWDLRDQGISGYFGKFSADMR
jgi:hypothetical protein